MSDWRTEIVQLHDFFDAWFRGDDIDFDRFDAALAPDFTIVGPDGEEQQRSTLVDFVRNAHGFDDELVIATSDHRLLHESADSVVAGYVETHSRGDKASRRRSTVVFRRDDAAINGLLWVRVHETWVDRP